MINNNYIHRVYELGNDGLTARELSKKIYDEYGISLKDDEIEKIISDYDLKSNSINWNNSTQNVDLILSAVEKNRKPVSAKEISKIIRNEYGVIIGRSTIKKLIYSQLNEKISFNPFLLKFILKKSDKPEKNVSRKNGKQTDFLKDLITECDSIDLLKETQTFFKGNLIEVSTGVKQIDDLIKLVVKDNQITECEELFLKSKANEHGYNEDIIETAKKSLNSNNPYLDNLIHIVFEDGIVTSQELLFLKEKTQENNFSTTFVNERFWTIGLAEYTQHMIKMNNLNKVLLIFIVLIRFDSNLFNTNKLFDRLNIFQVISFAEIIEVTLEAFSNELNKLLQKKYNLEFDYSKFLVENFEFMISEEKGETDNNLNDPTLLSMNKFLKILNQERLRIGSPDVNLLVENIEYRIENNLWD